MLEGKRIFVAEDETLIAMVLEDMLGELGFELAGSAQTVENAIELIKLPGKIDAAILDIELNVEKSWPIAAELAARDVPFAFATGHGPGAMVDPRFAAAPILDKPFDSDALNQVLLKLLPVS